MPIFIKLAVMALAVLSVSCGTGSVTRVSQRAKPAMYEWYDDGGPGKVSIRISLSDQIAEFERGGRPIGWCYVATGKEGHGTRAGRYTITEKIVDKYSNRYGWIEDEFGNVIDDDASPGDPVPPGARYVPAPMPYWMRLTSYGIGMHGGHIPNPGEPASHGCIRMPKRFVPMLFDTVQVGTPVTISGSISRQGPIVKRSPPPAESRGDYRVIDSRPLTETEARRISPSPPRRMTDPFSIY
jgi:hypothetical protein